MNSCKTYSYNGIRGEERTIAGGGGSYEGVGVRLGGP